MLQATGATTHDRTLSLTAIRVRGHPRTTSTRPGTAQHQDLCHVPGPTPRGYEDGHRDAAAGAETEVDPRAFAA